MSSEQRREVHAWPRAALSAPPGSAETGTDAALAAHNAPGATCKYPGCGNPRQARVSRRGAPPAYCTEPGHEPDAARRERRRRLRDGLPLDAALDDQHPQQDQGLEVPRSRPSPPPLPQPRAALEPGAAPIRVVPDEDSERGTSDPRSDLLSSGAASGPAQGWVFEPAEQARRLADQLALAAEAYEQLAGAVAAKDAENLELRRRLQHAEQALRGHLHEHPPD